MGAGAWSDSVYANVRSSRLSSGTPDFDYDYKVSSGLVDKKAHDSLDPKMLKNNQRECRDNSENPETNPVFVGLDVTGSMRAVPKTIQENLPKLMGLLLRKGYLTDPSICFAGIGDVKYDRVPFQVGQFEADIRVETHLTNMYLEGGGGGNMHESYEVALWFLANCVVSDAWEKRKTRGYAFIIGDEELSSKVLASEINQVFGFGPQADIPIEEVLKQVQERWNLYYIRPNLTAHYKDPRYQERWKKLLGQNVLYLDDPTGISEMVASTIGVMEEDADIVADMVSEGTSDTTARTVGTALTSLKKGVLSTKGSGLAKL